MYGQPPKAAALRHRLQGAVIAGLLAACGEIPAQAIHAEDPLHGPPPIPQAAAAQAEHFPHPPPPFTPGIFPCSRCHEGGEEVVDTAPAMPHQKHLGRELACDDCHPTEKGQRVIPDPKTCFDCHEDLGKEPEGVRDYFAAIRDGKGEYVFPRRWKTRDTDPKHDRHAAANIDCQECHGMVADGPIVKPKSLTLMARCRTCHESRKATDECAACHREIRDTQHRNIVLDHAEEQRGCLDCHSARDRDRLHLANGNLILFEESYKLCGQCHGPNLRDWKAGVHGRRTGQWNGRKEYLLCASCHNPHSPSWKPIEPKPPPFRPEEIR
jgi:hypothetical protein